MAWRKRCLILLVATAGAMGTTSILQAAEEDAKPKAWPVFDAETGKKVGYACDDACTGVCCNIL